MAAEKSTGGLNSVPKLPSESGPFSSSNNKEFRPITDLWTSGKNVSASEVAKECLSCDRWAGTMVIGGGVYLLWNSRKAPSISAKAMMAFAGGAMLVGGAYQGWVKNIFSEYRGWPPI
jgi:hypothetical protein